MLDLVQQRSCDLPHEQTDSCPPCPGHRSTLRGQQPPRHVLARGRLHQHRDVTKLQAFMLDLASRLANKVQLTTDGHKVYLEAVEGSLRK